MTFPTLPPGECADVCFVLEGTYPFVGGGVSSWIHQLLMGMPDLRFSIFFIGSSADAYHAPKYKMPENVVHLERHFLAEAASQPERARVAGDGAFFAASRAAHEAIRSPATTNDVWREPLRMLAESPARYHREFLYSERAWEEVRARYLENCSTTSFREYFWAVRSMHAPVLYLASAAKKCPPARVYHTISTGFAGMAGVLLSARLSRPLLLTEHGIYTKERKIDLLQAEWLREDAGENLCADEVGYVRHMWIRFFEGVGHIVYGASREITTLYEGNRKRQIADGASPEKSSVIPNGVDVPRLTLLREKRVSRSRLVVGLLGRVVPIKDIKTFISAMASLTSTLSHVDAWIIGPEDENEEYARECRDLAQALGLGDRLRFLGFQKIDDVLPEIDLLALTSISEAQPLVVLEGFAAGIPSVTTDVGCCRDLIFGGTDDDRALGAAGDVVSIGNPEAFATAASRLLSDRAKYDAAVRAATIRVERYYSQKVMIDSYRALYRRHLEPSTWPE